MRTQAEVHRALFHAFGWSAWIKGTPQERPSLLFAAQEHTFAPEDGKGRLLRAATALSKAFALSVPHEDALRICDDVGDDAVG